MRWVARSAVAAPPDLAQALWVESPLGYSAEISCIIAPLLASRGICDVEAAERFLRPTLFHLHSPSLMLGMNAALDRLEAAIERKEPLLIYGDYDVDGTTAIVILKTAVELCGGVAEFHVPHRIRDGYDMRDDVIERAAAEGIRLIISVDMGIRAFAPAETAHRLGVDLIVTDHHLPGQNGVPRALAVLNPNQEGCEYPCKTLCGAGVAFKLAQGLMERHQTGKNRERVLTSFMKIVAIATIADSVPLNGENRVFTKLGLEALGKPVNVGLKALIEVAQLGDKPLDSTDVGFRLAPRINAAGRMDVARDVIELFSVKDAQRAREIAVHLDQLNAERQEEERRIVAAIESRLEEDSALREAFCIVVDGEGWHRGVIGITASRVVERYGRPALVIAIDGDEAHGSGRSIRPFHLLNALESCGHLFTRYGGHSHAVGFSLPATRVPELRAHLQAYARERLTVADFEPTLVYDAELPLDKITPEFFDALSLLAPYGVRNPEPVFVAHSVRLTAPPRIIKEKHVRLKLGPHKLSDGRGGNSSGWKRAITYDALGWRMGERFQQEELLPGDLLDIAFTIDRNEHPEFGGLELSLRDFRRPNHPSASAGEEACSLITKPALDRG